MTQSEYIIFQIESLMQDIEYANEQIEKLQKRLQNLI